MTRLSNTPWHRVTVGTLDGSFGPDRNRPLVVSLVGGTAGDKDKPDYLLIRPLGTQRVERVNLIDLYRWALKCRVNVELLAKARERKARKAERLARRRLDSAERRLRERAREDV